MSTALTNPFSAWKARTKDGHHMAAGWVTARHTPSKRGEYEVRGHPRSFLTWAYGHWWYMERGTNDIPYWHLAPGRFGWKDTERVCDNSGIHGGDLLLKAVELGSEEAETELRALGWKGDYRPYANDRSWRGGA